MATLPPSASPFDPVLEIEDGTHDGTACVNAYYVAISEKSFDANDSGRPRRAIGCFWQRSRNTHFECSRSMFAGSARLPKAEIR